MSYLTHSHPLLVFTISCDFAGDLETYAVGHQLRMFYCVLPLLRVTHANVSLQDPLDGWEGACGGGPLCRCHGDGGHLCTEPETCCRCPLKGDLRPLYCIIMCRMAEGQNLCLYSTVEVQEIFCEVFFIEFSLHFTMTTVVWLEYFFFF